MEKKKGERVREGEGGSNVPSALKKWSYRQSYRDITYSLSSVKS